MRSFKGKGTAIIVGAALGAILMALVITMVFGLQTGIAGAMLVILIVAVSVLSGWMIGLNQRIQRQNYYSYMRGYREGMAKNTTIIKNPSCGCTFMILDTAQDLLEKND